MRLAMALLASSLSACGSEVVLTAPSDPAPSDDPPPTVPEDPPGIPPEDPPEDPPVDPPGKPPPGPPPGCELAVTVDTIGGSLDCGYGAVLNAAPALLTAVHAAPEAWGVRFEVQGCPAGEDCLCSITVSCVGTDVADVYAGATPTPVASLVEPDEVILGPPWPWECLDCSYGPPFFHAAAALTAGATITVEAGPLTGSETVGEALYETRALDGAAYEILGLAPVQVLLGTASVAEGQTMALWMDDDLLKLSFRNLRSTWCVQGCGPEDPTVGSAAWVVFGPVP